MDSIGEMAALGVAVSWTASAIFFEKAGRNIGSLTLNILRIGLAIVLLGVATWFTRGSFFPTDAGYEQWLWLSLSGVIGFFIGDLCLFHSYLIVGARMAQLIMTLAPVMTATVGFLMLGETLTGDKIVGVMLVVGGIFVAMLGKNDKRIKFNMPIKGFLFAFGGALGQAIGFVLSKKGIQNYDPMAATQIRAIAGFVSFSILLTAIRHWPKIWKAVHQPKDMHVMFWGTVFGPFIGVSLSLFAVQHTSTGVAATLMGMVPIFIILPSYFIMKEKVTLIQIIGTLVSVGGSVLLFI